MEELLDILDEVKNVAVNAREDLAEKTQEARDELDAAFDLAKKEILAAAEEIKDA